MELDFITWPQQLVTIPHKISGMFEPMLSPVMASLHNQRRSRQIQANLMSVCRWVFTFQLALSIPMIVFSGPLLMLFGSDFSAGALVLSVLLIAELVDGTFLSVETPLVYARPKIPPTLLVLAIIIEVLLIALLSSIFGAVGAAWGYLFTIVFLTAGRLVMLRQTLGINVINNSYLIPLIAGLGMSAILVTLRQFEPVSPVIIGFAIVAALLGFAGIIKTYSLSKSDRILIRALSRRRKRTVQ